MSFPKRKVPLIDLALQQKSIRKNLENAWKIILDHGQYIMGPEVKLLEKKLAHFSGAKYAVSCSSGTDALLLILMAHQVQPGDAVFLPAFTFPATAEVIALLGATPVFVDVDPTTYQLDASMLGQAISKVKQEAELHPKMIITVDLFGHPADYKALEEIASEEQVLLMVDAAQSFGARYHNRNVGQIGIATALSFYPTKPLSSYGDAGAVLTDDEELYYRLISLREHGSEPTNKYNLNYIGLNARMDSIQAAVLLEKLNLFPDERLKKQQVADWYHAHLPEWVQRPYQMDGCISVWAQYTVCIKDELRDAVQAFLHHSGVSTGIYYPKLISDQKPYAQAPCYPESLPNSMLLTQTVLSLPMHPGMVEDDVIYIAYVFEKALQNMTIKA
jgi:UDP-2-acetamido-2-deoxy-ribo-hexuluronate aminotransferase